MDIEVVGKMSQDRQLSTDDLYRTLRRAILFAAGLYALFLLIDAATFIILFFLLAVVLAMALNPPVTWLEQHRVPRAVAVLIVIVLVAVLLGLLAWLVVPRVAAQSAVLASDVPGYVTSLVNRASSFFEDYPQIRERLSLSGKAAQKALPSAWSILARIGRYSLSAITLAIFIVVLISTVIYMLSNPRPLLKGYLGLIPAHMRDKATNAFTKSSQMVFGWIMSNVIIGGIEAVAATVFLMLIGVPGAFVWGAFTFFAELVPRLGLYLMMIPPTIVAFAVNPWTALWVVIFYLVLTEITGDFVAPLVRGSQMNLHPVSLIFAVLAMASIFGFLGAVIATPVVGIIKAYYEELYLSRQPEDDQVDARTERMLAWWGEDSGGSEDGD
ncbi:MAG: AI-2E family transporter [Armatimonadota bacterium]